MTRRVTVAVCILVFVFGRHKIIRQLCTGVICRYQVQVFIHKKISKLSLSSQDLPYLLHPYLVNASVSLIIPTFFTVFSPLYSRRIVCRGA